MNVLERLRDPKNNHSIRVTTRFRNQNTLEYIFCDEILMCKYTQVSYICIFEVLTFLVQELKGGGQVANDITGLLFGKSNTILDMVQ